MSDHDVSKTKIIQENNPNTLDKKLSYLKLVVSNPPPIQKKASARTVHSNTGFTAKIRKRGHSCYVLIARDSSHYLDCQIILEIHNNQGEEE